MSNDEPNQYLAGKQPPRGLAPSELARDDLGRPGRGELAFIIASAAIFLAIAGCVVYFVARIII